jgi:hypothetical protein
MEGVTIGRGGGQRRRVAKSKSAQVANDYLSQRRLFCCTMRTFVGRFTTDNYADLGKLNKAWRTRVVGKS